MVVFARPGRIEARFSAGRDAAKPATAHAICLCSPRGSHKRMPVLPGMATLGINPLEISGLKKTSYASRRLFSNSRSDQICRNPSRSLVPKRVLFCSRRTATRALFSLLPAASGSNSSRAPGQEVLWSEINNHSVVGFPHLVHAWLDAPALRLKRGRDAQRQAARLRHLKKQPAEMSPQVIGAHG